MPNVPANPYIGYIQPSTEITLYANCPLVSDYQHTMYFGDVTEQNMYFNSLTKKVYNSNTYTNINYGVIRIADTVTNCYNKTYMKFVNKEYLSGEETTGLYENRTYYCFIEDVIYINNNTTEIHYTIDVIQTYLFDFTDYTGTGTNKIRMTQSRQFIEREIVASDTIKNLLVPEGLDCGSEYILENIYHINESGNIKLLLTSTETPTINGSSIDWSEGESTAFLGGVLSGVKYTVIGDIIVNGTFQSSIKDTLDTWIKAYVKSNKTNSILGIYEVPSWYGSGGNEPLYKRSGNNIQQYFVNTPNSLDGYTFKNKKLGTYPYTFVQAYNNTGDSYIYKFENSSDRSNIKFIIGGYWVNTPYMFLLPLSYRGFGGITQQGLSNNLDFYDMLSLELPQIPWISDGFQEWFASNGTALAYKAGTSIASIFAGGGMANMGLSMLTKSIRGSKAESKSTALAIRSNTNTNRTLSPNEMLGLGGIKMLDKSGSELKSGLTGIAGVLTDVAQGSTLPDTAHGLNNNNFFNMATNRYGFTLATYGIKNSVAKRIDAFFSTYGYKVNMFDVVCLKNRKKWTYVKTNGCSIGNCGGYSLNIPNKFVDTINQIFDNGITFWDCRTDTSKFRVYGDYTNEELS